MMRRAVVVECAPLSYDALELELEDSNELELE